MAYYNVQFQVHFPVLSSAEESFDNIPRLADMFCPTCQQFWNWYREGPVSLINSIGTAWHKEEVVLKEVATILSSFKFTFLSLAHPVYVNSVKFTGFPSC